jgi:anti-sigma B factor antagonist
MALQIHHTEVRPGTVVIALAGKMMVGSGSEQVATLVDELLAQGAKTIIFDLGGLTALDSTGVGQFISSFNRIAGMGGDMRMAGATGHVFRTFHVSMLDRMFRFYPTAEEAAAV